MINYCGGKLKPYLKLRNGQTKDKFLSMRLSDESALKIHTIQQQKNMIRV